MKKLSKVKVCAIILQGIQTNSHFIFEIGGWKIFKQNPVALILEKEFNDLTTDNDYYKAIEDLNAILLSLFINDHHPRKIHTFEFPSIISKRHLFQLYRIFGQPPFPDENIEHIAVRAFSRGGFIFGSKIDQIKDINYTPDTSLIEDWFHFFKKDQKVARSVFLIQEAFGQIHDLSYGLKYIHNFLTHQAIILLVSGLEGLFRRGEGDHSDITFKFQTIGSLFYDQYVTAVYLNEYSPPQKKFTFSEFKMILHSIYRIRSTFAHGDALIPLKELKNILGIVRLQYSNVNIEIERNRLLLHALGILKIHLIALIYLARENLFKGVNIIDDIIMRERCNESSRSS